jgi:hypothetical protein
MSPLTNLHSARAYLFMGRVEDGCSLRVCICVCVCVCVCVCLCVCLSLERVRWAHPSCLFPSPKLFLYQSLKVSLYAGNGFLVSVTTPYSHFPESLHAYIRSNMRGHCAAIHAAPARLDALRSFTLTANRAWLHA